MAGRVLVGTFSIDINNVEFKQFTDGTGVRVYRKYIKFDPDLTGTVDVVAALRHIDLAGGGLRIVVNTENIDREGFDLVFQTWADTKIAGVGCSWTATYG